MSTGFFARVHVQTPTRFWINNPTPEQARAAIAYGARNCTTNPAYASKMLPTLAADEREAMLAAALRAGSDIDDAADLVQCATVQRILPVFEALHRADPQGSGFVSIQGDPHKDTDVDHILQETRRYAGLGPNVIYKIPATAAGLQAAEVLLADGKPVIATEMFSVAQTRSACAVYRRATAGGGRPPFYITHITGIYDEYLAGVAAEQAPELAAADLQQAGFLLARRVRQVLTEEDLPITLLGGGARGLTHFTDMIGGDLHVTINPDMVEDLERDPPAITDRFATPIDETAVARLRAALPDFRAAWDEDGLAEADYERYGPVLHFLASFKKGWAQVREALEALAARA